MTARIKLQSITLKVDVLYSLSRCVLSLVLSLLSIGSNITVLKQSYHFNRMSEHTVSQKERVRVNQRLNLKMCQP